MKSDKIMGQELRPALGRGVRPGIRSSNGMGRLEAALGRGLRLGMGLGPGSEIQASTGLCAWAGTQASIGPGTRPRDLDSGRHLNPLKVSC